VGGGFGVSVNVASTLNCAPSRRQTHDSRPLPHSPASHTATQPATPPHPNHPPSRKPSPQKKNQKSAGKHPTAPTCAIVLQLLSPCASTPSIRAATWSGFQRCLAWRALALDCCWWHGCVGAGGWGSSASLRVARGEAGAGARWWKVVYNRVPPWGWSNEVDWW